MKATRTLSRKQKGEICHRAIDRVWMATPRTFLIDFEDGGSLTVRINNGLNRYNEGREALLEYLLEKKGD